MTHLASTAPLSSLATEALALRLARDAERFRAANDDGTLLAAALTEALSALPPPLCEKVRLTPVARRSGARRGRGSLAAILRRVLLLALPPFLLTPRLRSQLIPCLDWHCTLALRELLSSGAVQLPELSDDDLVARHFAYAQAEVLPSCPLAERDAR